MDTYSGRLQTFANWPADSSVTPEALAAAGQYYTGNGDETRCYMCSKRLSGWKKGDDPHDEHKSKYPQCKLSKESMVLSQEIKGATHSDRGVTLPATKELSPAVRELDISGKTSQPDYRYLKERLATFAKWPLGGVQWDQNMALAGFIYTGMKDQVECHLCKVILSNWDATDIPVYEHRNLSRDCPYMKYILKEKKDMPAITQLPTVDQQPTYVEAIPEKSGAPIEERIPLPETIELNPPCIMCRQRPREILFEPCSHFVVCETCSAECTTCPVCGCAILKKTRYKTNPTQGKT